MKVLGSLREIFWEAKRAPSTLTTLLRNPYRREKITKKIYGKTAEERKASKAILNEEISAKVLKIDTEEL